MKKYYKNKVSKYHTSAKNERTVDGITFDSKKEMHRFFELKMLERAGEIRELERQKEFILQEEFFYFEKKIRAIKYFADFFYFDVAKNCYVAEDVKSEITKKIESYKIKKKLFQKKFNDIYFFEND